MSNLKYIKKKDRDYIISRSQAILECDAVDPRDAQWIENISSVLMDGRNSLSLRQLEVLNDTLSKYDDLNLPMNPPVYNDALRDAKREINIANKKYNKLLKKWNSLVPKYNEL